MIGYSADDSTCQYKCQDCLDFINAKQNERVNFVLAASTIVVSGMWNSIQGPISSEPTSER
jgi:hypothetical protein